MEDDLSECNFPFFSTVHCRSFYLYLAIATELTHPIVTVLERLPKSNTRHLFVSYPV